MKEQYITITGFRHYYGLIPFKIGKRLKCIKEPENPFDTEAIRVALKQIGTIGYVANSIHTVARGTSSAGAIAHSVKNSFIVEVMFMTDSHIICKIVEGQKEKQTPSGKKRYQNDCWDY